MHTQPPFPMGKGLSRPFQGVRGWGDYTEAAKEIIFS